MRPSPSAKTRSARTLSASRSACSGPSSCVTPSSTSRPGPIAARRSSPTLTEARLTRWTSARTSGFAQLGGGLLGRDDAEVHAGAELEPRELGEPRQDVDPPAEVLRAARSGADPEI